jgi:uncharacterized cupredoxin-like copper-binding protein
MQKHETGLPKHKLDMTMRKVTRTPTMKTPGLLLATSAACLIWSAAQAQNTQQLHISLTTYAFTPAMITLKVGRTYRLHLTNDSNKDHDFRAAEFFAASTVAPEDRGKIEDGSEVDVDPGKPVDVTLTPMRAGAYPLTCSHFLHPMLGMRGTILVQ